MKKLLALLILPLLAACSSWNPIDYLTPHRIDIQQGNAITQEMLAKLKPGMTPSQVRFVLGTPLIVDPFRNNRWDYVYSLKREGNVLEQRRVTIVFENGLLKGVEGDVVPAEKPAAAVGPATVPAEAAATTPAKTEEAKP